MKKTSTLLLLGILLLILTAGYTGYLYWQKSQSEVELKTVENNLNEYKNTVLQYENKRIKEAISAKKAIDEIKASAFRWSEVINTIRKTLPKSALNKDLVEVLSYSASIGSDISMNIKTLPGSENPFIDAANLIETFDRSENFKNPFVPGLSLSKDEKGNEFVNFAMTVNFVKPSVEEILEKNNVKPISR